MEIDTRNRGVGGFTFFSAISKSSSIGVFWRGRRNEERMKELGTARGCGRWLINYNRYSIWF
jgi:hypothetical protein